MTVELKDYLVIQQGLKQSIVKNEMELEINNLVLSHIQDKIFNLELEAKELPFSEVTELE